MRAIIYNNTMGFHCGSDAAMEVLLKVLRAEGHVIEGLVPNVPLDYAPWAKMLSSSAEAVIVHGEGTLHHDTIGALRIGDTLRRSLELGKRTYLVNTVWQDVECISNEVLNALSGVSVREECSRRQLEERGFSKAIRMLDLSYYADVAEIPSLPDGFKGGGSLATDFYIHGIGFMRPTTGAINALQYVDLKTVSWGMLVHMLRASSLLVTGRHHAVYAACRARTPFAALAGNTHKIDGLIAGSGINIPIASSARDLNATIDWAMRNRSAFDDLFDWMESQQPWRGLCDFEK